ncbi:MAG: hypothetical protein CMJ31_14195 [Phycisphaerae bacterium]|nr:hypothetical protein [Phycisphaerae bacterium]
MTSSATLAFDPTDVARRLTAAVAGEVRFGLHDRMLYATDASHYQVEPLGVVIPADAEDAARAVRFCHKNGLPILPRGGGTSLAGQCTAQAVVVDLSAGCLRLHGVDADRRTCRVEAGVTIEDLNDELRSVGLFFAPDPSTARHATIGGSIGNNAAGAHSLLYGRTAESLLGVDVCLIDGRRVTFDEGAATRDPVVRDLTERVAEIVRSVEGPIRERFPKTRRRNAGYALDMILDDLDAGGIDAVNLAHLICGSEGTLAVTLGAELALQPVPKAKGLAVVAFAELDDSMDALLSILETGPAAVELLDDLVIDLARHNIEHRGAVELLPRPAGGSLVNAVHYVEYFGASAEEVAAKLDRIRSMFPAGQVETHTDQVAMKRAWALRKAGEPLLHGIPGERKPLGFVEDNAVPPERLAEFVRGFRAIVEREGTRAAFYAHASVGVLHVRPLLSLRSDSDTAAMERIAVEVAALAKSLGGVMSGEHGDGRVRGPLLDAFYGPEIMDAFRRVKAVFDPKNLLNPGNIVDPRPIETIHELTRIDPTPGREIHIPDVNTYFDYGDQTDFAHAVEMCNGAGVCRKKAGGVMCPSYMGTLDERHATRGRGNALRLAISGQLNADGSDTPAWDDAETIATLDLCLSCKACKSECPSNVDVARLKAEYTAQRYRTKGAPLRSRIFGKIHELSAIAALSPGMANFFGTFGPTRAVANAVLGLDPRRSLPRFERPLHRVWGVGTPGLRRGLVVDAPVVVLYGDTFTTYNEPRIGLAAREVLEAFGYRVRLHRGRDAGRACMSLGLLEDAIRSADRELASLGPIAEDESVEAILFLEPSVLSAVQDDWLSLKLKSADEARRRVASRSSLVEQFLNERWESHPRVPTFDAPEAEILLHGHCHQKALWGPGSSAGVLERAFPGRVRMLDTTCCGMAGSFGYTKERFDLSMRIGELGVLPHARREDAAIVAPGTSCRHQIHDGAGRRALHPVELLAGALARAET